MNKNNLFRLIVGCILKLAIFLAVWMLMGNWLFDTGECNFFGIDNPNISLLLFGIVTFVGSETIYYGASKLKKVIQTKRASKSSE